MPPPITREQRLAQANTLKAKLDAARAEIKRKETNRGGELTEEEKQAVINKFTGMGAPMVITIPVETTPVVEDINQLTRRPIDVTKSGLTHEKRIELLQQNINNTPIRPPPPKEEDIPEDNVEAEDDEHPPAPRE